MVEDVHVTCTIFTKQKSPTRLSIWVFNYVLRCNIYHRTQCLYKKGNTFKLILESIYFRNLYFRSNFQNKGNNIDVHVTIDTYKNLSFTLLDQLDRNYIFIIIVETSTLFSF